jgi:hypothetical protein
LICFGAIVKGRNITVINTMTHYRETIRAIILLIRNKIGILHTIDSKQHILSAIIVRFHRKN